ncbi:hypothetical protein FAI41_03210 [Acetobacteraceae bacterium]|nr:hypothetical protein FAI41_03210 [Acetobacteraceae bacterium]
MKFKEVRKSRRLTLFLLSAGFVPSLGMSAPYPFPFYENLPSALVGFDKQNRPVAFCRLNLDHSLTCFDKEAREYQVGTLSYPTKLYANWKLTLKKPVSPYIAKMVPQISQFGYSDIENGSRIDGFATVDALKNVNSTGFGIYSNKDKKELWQLDDTDSQKVKLVGTVPAAVLKKMATYSQEDLNYIGAKRRAFVAETQPGYNIPSTSSGASCDHNDVKYSGNVSSAQGYVGSMDSSGNISNAQGFAGHVGANGNISNQQGFAGRIDSSGNISTSKGYLGRVDAGGPVSVDGKIIGFFDAKSGTVSNASGGYVGHVPPCNRVLAFELLTNKLGN